MKCWRPRRPTPRAWCGFAPGFSRGAGGLAPGLLVASDGKADYNFLDLAADRLRPHRPRRQGPRRRPKALDAFVYAERGVYRSGETVHLAALLRDNAGTCRQRAADPGRSSARTAWNIKRASLPDKGLGGRELDVALPS